MNGKPTKAHRASWIYHYGSIPDGKQVLHKCDNRLCINPKHLFLGTNLDNIIDCMVKGRRGRRLTDDEVVWIRKVGMKKYLQCELAKMFKVSFQQINNIVLYKQRLLGKRVMV